MDKDLTNSLLDRQNVLNNGYAIEKAKEYLNLGGVFFNNDIYFTKQQVMTIYEIADTTIERYINQHREELEKNGYILLRGKNLKDFKDLMSGTLINEGTKTTVLGLFSFKAVLNLAMLLTESDKAKEMRSKILDIVINVLAEKTGGHTKYINQRDEHYLVASFQEQSYRKQFTDALDQYIEDTKFKYVRFTNLIYQSIFKENAAQYRKILSLSNRDNIRNTMYSEVLTLIASFESGIAFELQKESERIARKLTNKEADILFRQFESHPLFAPLILDARTKMASRDLCFRDALHKQLEEYIQSVPQADFERFLGETSKSLEERFSDPETLDVFKRLKDR